MAKINDLKRAIALDLCRSISDKTGHYVVPFDARCLNALSIKFGQENRKGIGDVKVSFDLYITPNMYKFTFDGWYDHVNDDVEFKCVTIEKEFSPGRLFSINNSRFEGLWFEEEEGDAAAAVPVIASVEAESDFNVKRYSAVK